MAGRVVLRRRRSGRRRTGPATARAKVAWPAAAWAARWRLRERAPRPPRERRSRGGPGATSRPGQLRCEAPSRCYVQPPMRPQVALPSILIAILLGAFALAGCGGGDAGDDASASELIQQTFGNAAQLKSGRIGLGLDAELKSGSVQASVDARFAQSEPGQLPRLAGTLKLDSGTGTLQAGAISTGDQGYITVAGQAFAVPDSDWKTFTQGYLADQKKTDQQRAAQPTLSSLGVHPRAVAHRPAQGRRGRDRRREDDPPDRRRRRAQDARRTSPRSRARPAPAGQLSALGTDITSAGVQIDTGSRRPPPAPAEDPPGAQHRHARPAPHLQPTSASPRRSRRPRTPARCRT